MLKLFKEIRLVIMITILVIFFISLAVTYNIADLMARPIFIDGLTGTYNHKYFQEMLSEEINRAGKGSTPLAVLMMDLDYFKTVNDTYGHRFGDVVLKSTAMVLKVCVRKGDILARYGGEEFTAILPNTGEEEAFALANRIRYAVEEQSIYCEEAGRNVKITISIGVAGWKPGMSRNELVDRADMAMYQSKHNNRNQVTIYTEEETKIS